MAKVSGGGTGAAALQKIGAQLAKTPLVRVGFLEGSVNSQGISIPMIAAIQEFGAPRAKIPPRPFFRTMIAKHKAEWGPEFAALMKAMRPNVLKRVFTGWSAEKDQIKALHLMGQRMAEELQQSIRDLHAPPLSPVTLMLRWMRWKKPALKVTGKTVGEAAARVAAGKSSAGVSIKPLIDRGDLIKAVAFEVSKK